MREELLLFLGVIFIFIGILFLVIASLLVGGKTEVAVGGFVGPIPFGFAKGNTAFKLLIVLLYLMLVVLFIINVKK